MSIEIAEHLRVQGYGRKRGKKYSRIVIPAKIAKDEDIQTGDLVKVTIVAHIKVGRKKEDG